MAPHENKRDSDRKKTALARASSIPYLRMYRPHIFCQKFKSKTGVRLIFEITLHLKKNYIHN